MVGDPWLSGHLLGLVAQVVGDGRGHVGAAVRGADGGGRVADIRAGDPGAVGRGVVPGVPGVVGVRHRRIWKPGRFLLNSRGLLTLCDKTVSYQSHERLLDHF